MKYPPLPEKYDRRKKLMLKQLSEIKILRAKGYSYQKIANKFKVSTSTIYEHLNLEKYIEKRKRKAKENLQKYHQNALYRLNSKIQSTELRRRKRIIFKSFEQNEINRIKNKYIRLKELLAG